MLQLVAYDVSFGGHTALSVCYPASSTDELLGDRWHRMPVWTARILHLRHDIESKIEGHV